MTFRDVSLIGFSSDIVDTAVCLVLERDTSSLNQLGISSCDNSTALDRALPEAHFFVRRNVSWLLEARQDGHTPTSW